MESEKQPIDKTLTGISGEFFVAAELARRGYNITVTFGNTKSIDLLVEKKGITIPVQVKAIHSVKSISFNVKLNDVQDERVYVLVNINAVSFEQPEFFIFLGKDIKPFIKIANSGRDWLNLSELKRSSGFNNWMVFENYKPRAVIT